MHIIILLILAIAAFNFMCWLGGIFIGVVRNSLEKSI